MVTLQVKIRRWSIAGALLLLLSVLMPARAQEAPPDLGAVKQKLETLTAIEQPDSGQQEEIETLRATLDALEDLESTRKERA